MNKVISIVSHRQFKNKLQDKAQAISPMAMMLGFTVLAVIMTAVIVWLGVSNWQDALAIASVVGVIALVKILLANFVFLALLKADQREDPRLARMTPQPEPPADRRVVPLRPQTVTAQVRPVRQRQTGRAAAANARWK
ncbi:MAG: hypothetical protein ACREP6_03880 [Candidatus Binataceae bacterium]